MNANNTATSISENRDSNDIIISDKINRLKTKEQLEIIKGFLIKEINLSYSGISPTCNIRYNKYPKLLFFYLLGLPNEMLEYTYRKIKEKKQDCTDEIKTMEID